MLLQGCSDWLREEDSSKLTYDYYSTEKGIDAALVSVYSYMRWGAKERSDMMNELGVDLFTEARDGGGTFFESYSGHIAFLNFQWGHLPAF